MTFGKSNIDSLILFLVKDSVTKLVLFLENLLHNTKVPVKIIACFKGTWIRYVWSCVYGIKHFQHQELAHQIFLPSLFVLTESSFLL